MATIIEPGLAPSSARPAQGSLAGSAPDGLDRSGDGAGTGTSVHETAHDAASAVKERAGALWGDAKDAARSKLDQQKDAAADGLGDVAGALRDVARRKRDDAARTPIAELTGSVADGLDRLSSTLRSKDVGSMLRDVENFARNQPVAFFGLALAAGFVAVRFLKADND